MRVSNTELDRTIHSDLTKCIPFNVKTWLLLQPLMGLVWREGKMHFLLLPFTSQYVCEDNTPRPQKNKKQQKQQKKKTPTLKTTQCSVSELSEHFLNTEEELENRFELILTGGLKKKLKQTNPGATPYFQQGNHSEKSF